MDQQNPYQTPVTESMGGHHEAGFSVALIALTVLMLMQVLFFLVLGLFNFISGNPAAALGGLASFTYQIAASIGLLYWQEWARISSLFMSYMMFVTTLALLPTIGLFAAPFLLLFAATIILAHLPAVKRNTKLTSTAKEYFYTEKSIEH